MPSGCAPKGTRMRAGQVELELADVLEQQRHADRGDQRVEPRRVAQRPVGERSIGSRSRRRRPSRRAARRPRPPRRRRRGRRRSARTAPASGEADPRAEHDDVAVGEVDELEDAVHQRVAQRDQRVEAADGDGDDEGLKEVGHGEHGGSRLAAVASEAGHVLATAREPPTEAHSHGLTRRHERRLAVLELQDDGRLHGVAVASKVIVPVTPSKSFVSAIALAQRRRRRSCRRV